MRFLKYLFLVVVAIVLVVLAMANRDVVTVKLLPAELASEFGQPFSYELPLFAVIFAGIVVGLLIGFVWEWFREHKHRSAVRVERREREKLEREVKGLKRHANEGRDDVLALLDDASATR